MPNTKHLENEFEGIIIETLICRYKEFSEQQPIENGCLYCDGYSTSCRFYQEKLE